MLDDKAVLPGLPESLGLGSAGRYLITVVRFSGDPLPSEERREEIIGALHIHPRTLDYRLRRIRELAGMDPGSYQGVRALGAAVARTLAGRWN